jgi:hypothetical protein
MMDEEYDVNESQKGWSFSLDGHFRLMVILYVFLILSNVRRNCVIDAYDGCCFMASSNWLAAVDFLLD